MLNLFGTEVNHVSYSVCTGIRGRCTARDLSTLHSAIGPMRCTRPHTETKHAPREAHLQVDLSLSRKLSSTRRYPLINFTVLQFVSNFVSVRLAYSVIAGHCATAKQATSSRSSASNAAHTTQWMSLIDISGCHPVPHHCEYPMCIMPCEGISWVVLKRVILQDDRMITRWGGNHSKGPASRDNALPCYTGNLICQAARI